MTIELKSWPDSFDAVAAGVKTAEIRSIDDRQFQIGDTVILRRWNPVRGEYTGAKARILIRHIELTAGNLMLVGYDGDHWPTKEPHIAQLAVLSFELLEVTVGDA